MPKKLTLVGVLAAMVFGAVMVAGDAGKTFAGAGPNQTPIQPFVVSNDICYGSHPTDGAQLCPGSSGTAVGASSAVTQYTNIKLGLGTRLTLPVTYSPGSFTFTPGAVSSTVGDVTALSDILCDGTSDVLSAGNPDNANDPNAKTGNESAGNLPSWPSTTNWAPYPVEHLATGAIAGSHAYVASIKPTPASFTVDSHDLSEFYTLWLGGAGIIDLFTNNGGVPTPLNIVVETSPYTTGLRTSVALLAGSPAPPTNSFALCLDSPQNSVAANTQVTTPAIAGLYPRWTIFTSSIDVRHWTVSRLVDLACVNVGGFAANDDDGDCLQDAGAGGTDANDGNADQDGDQLADGIEAAFGTNMNALDTDGDGADDMTEMANFTRPMEGGPGFLADCDGGGPQTNNNADDTDCDGQLDLPENGADANTASKGTFEDTAADDNCPVDANSTQTNSDSIPVANFLSGDLSIADQDLDGDACDTDDDNDGIADVVEDGAAAADVGAAPNWCAPDASGTDLGVSGLDFDSDNDLALDGLECKFQSQPNVAINPSGRVVVVTADFLSDGSTGSQETFYRTQQINLTGGGQEDDLDDDGLCGGGSGGAGCAGSDNDTDADFLLDGTEVLYYGSNPSNDDTDGDGCKDGTEAADVNGDRNVNVLDLSHVATRSTTTPFAGGRYRDLPTAAGNYATVDYVTLDFTKDGSINVFDLQQIAAQIALAGTTENCGGVNPGLAQGGVTVTNDDDGAAP